MVVQAQGWVWDILRTMFAGLDLMIYSLIKWILFGIFDLSSLTTSSDLLNGIYSRIYVILGVFMAFKLSFSFFQYIIDPESMSGKSEKGVSKLITRTVVMIIALVALPTILFNTDNGGGLIQRAQKAFLPMLPRVLLGVNGDDNGLAFGNGNNEGISEAANIMAVSTLQAFFAPSSDIDSYCGDGTYDNTPTITSLDEFMANVNLTCNVGLNINLGVLGNVGATRYYKYSYNYGISTIVGILMVVMLLGITIDVAKRVFKMIILEVIAPVPIMTLIDPKSSKDGAFSHWLKSLISTFLDIFIKLGLLYIIIMLIQLIVNHGLFVNWPTFSEEPVRASYLTVILILGLIFFAKEAPKFIKDALGIKNSDSGSSALGIFGGALAGGASGFVSGAISGRGLSGALTGMATGASAGIAAAGTGKPSNAWKSAGDAAGQMRTGDKNYKSGFAASLQRNVSKVQGESTARKMGITLDTLSVAKKNSEALASEAASAKDIYDRFLNDKLDVSEADAIASAAGYNVTAPGVYTDNSGNSTSLQKILYDRMSEAELASTKATKKYEKASKVAESFGITRTPQQEFTMSRGKKDKYTSKHTSASNIDRTNRVIDRAKAKGAFDPGATANSSNVDQFK